MKLTENEREKLLKTLHERFDKNLHRHTDIQWIDVEKRLRSQTDKLWSVNEMELSGGEPDIIAYDKNTDEYIICDCSKESPSGRRSVCYDYEALESRKEHKPKDSAMNMAATMGVELLDEEQYGFLQTLEHFDTKTSSWLKTESGVRENGGAVFGDYRYGRVFYYHNGAESYYAARGFRGILRV
ncbi:MAG: hypothetical protein BGO29_01040 [Bacteroidales bacterium 36-12]|nr:MAG: hypothetical protein BGO29_01040 [Bacteroidales bacterium 36-12]